MKNIDYFIEMYPNSIKFLEELKEDYNFTISVEKEKSFDLEENLKSLGLSDIEISDCTDNFERLLVKILRSYEYYKVYYVKKQWVYEFYKHILTYEEFDLRRGKNLLKDIFKKRAILVDSFKSKVMYYDDSIFLCMLDRLESLTEQAHNTLFLIDRRLRMPENDIMTLKKFLNKCIPIYIDKEKKKLICIAILMRESVLKI